MNIVHHINKHKNHQSKYITTRTIYNDKYDENFHLSHIDSLDLYIPYMCTYIMDIKRIGNRYNKYIEQFVKSDITDNDIELLINALTSNNQFDITITILNQYPKLLDEYDVDDIDFDESLLIYSSSSIKVILYKDYICDKIIKTTFFHYNYISNGKILKGTRMLKDNIINL